MEKKGERNCGALGPKENCAGGVGCLVNQSAVCTYECAKGPFSVTFLECEAWEAQERRTPVPNLARCIIYVLPSTHTFFPSSAFSHLINGRESKKKDQKSKK